MEFTPKKQPLATVSTSAVRHNPYASGGGNFIRKYRQHRNVISSPRKSGLVTPPRTNVQRRFTSRADKILASSKTRSLPEKTISGKIVNKPKNSPQATKRPFRAINGLDTTKDPYNIFTDSEDENQASPPKETKSLVINDKENVYCSSEDEIFVSSSKERKKQASSEKANSLFTSPASTPNSVKVYVNKRKPLFVARSRLVNDISPDKVEKAYGSKSLLIAEKENVPTKSTAESSTPQVLLPHLIGFPNYGNTCYLNSVLQSLFGLPSFLFDYRKIASELGLNSTSLFYGLSQVLYNRMKGQASGVKVSLRTVKENLERIDGSFSGYKMQDANEFLTKVLDTIKDEIDCCHASKPDSSTSSSQAVVCNGSEDIDEDILLCGAKKQSSKKRLNFATETEVNFSSEMTDNEIINCVSTIDSLEKQNDGVTEMERTLNIEKCKESGGVREGTCDNKNTESHGKLEVKNETDSILRNPVKDNFEFQLLESYRCLGCGEVVGRKQEYFGLYVNLPEDTGHNIQDAISTYMSADERELTCEKCGHDTSSVVTTITSLPRILIIQLKRYEYKTELCESIKMSSKVHVNRWICLDNFMTDDVAGPSQWNPESGSVQTTHDPKESTLTVRNLSSELNKCNPKEEEELPSLSPVKPFIGVSSSVPDNEDEELQMVMRRSMDDVQGGQEEDEIQQAIRLSLQEMGMSYSQENQGESSSMSSCSNSEQYEDEKQDVAVEENKESGRHAYCLISIISHFGLTTNTGHYVSDVYNCDEDSWFHYDDESVAKISESVVFAEGRQKNGYIFFYMHKDLFQKIKNKDKR